MSRLLAEVAWSRQPPAFAQIAQQYREGLFWAFTGEGGVRDLSGKYPPTTATATAALGNDARALAFDGTSSTQLEWGSGGGSQPYAETTVLVLCVPRAWYATIFARRNSDSTSGVDFGIDADGYALMGFGASGSWDYAMSPGTVALDQKHVIIGRHSVAKAALDVRVDKAAPGTKACYSGGPAVTRMAFGQDTDNYYFDGDIYLGLVWNKWLPDGAIRDLIENPWRVFEPLRQITMPLMLVDPPQLLSPTGRLAGSTWTASTGGTTYSCVDETSPDDGDYAYTATPDDWEEFTFDAPDSGHNGSAEGGYVRYRLPAGSGAITVELRQGSTVLESWGPHTLTGALQAFAQQITASTSNSSDLRLRFTAS